MEIRRLGRTGLQVSVLGLGGAEIGFGNVDDPTIDKIIGLASDAGVNVIDTAAQYADGEEKIGRAIRNQRSKFLIFTKCGASPPPRRTARGLYTRLRHRIVLRNTAAALSRDVSWTPRVLQWNIERSLRRLGVDYIDIIQLHCCTEQVLRQGLATEVLCRAREAGKVRYIGYSGDGEAALFALRSGEFDVLQTSVNIADQEALDTTIPLAIKSDIGVIAKRPIANQLWNAPMRPHGKHYTAYWDRLRSLRYDFLDGDRAIETALRFTLSVPGVHSAIVGTTNPAHFNQNMASLQLGALPQDAFDAIRETWRRTALSTWVGQT